MYVVLFLVIISGGFFLICTEWVGHGTDLFDLVLSFYHLDHDSGVWRVERCVIPSSSSPGAVTGVIGVGDLRRPDTHIRTGRIRIVAMAHF